MTDEYEQQRRDYYMRMTDPSMGWDAPTLALGQAHFDRVLAEARRDARVKPFQPLSDDARATYLSDAFGNTRPHGIGVRQGEFASIGADQVTEATRFLATDNLLDCHAVILVARDAQGRVLRSALSHLDRMTDIPVALAQMMEGMPAGAPIEATLLGSPQGYNHYFQAELLQALQREPRLTSIRYDFDAASTVAVDTSTGRLLTAAPQETAASAYNISELPVAITFPPVAEGLPVARSFMNGLMRQRQDWPEFPLHAVYDAQRHQFQPRDALGQFIAERQQSDGQLNAQELREIAAEIGRVLRHPVQLVYENPPQHFATIHVTTENDQPLGDFYSNALDPALGIRGTIRTEGANIAVARR